MQKGFFAFFTLFLKGVCMGVADIIPGVSGGTIAFITGIYDELLESIKSIHYKKKGKNRSTPIRWKFLLTLGSGIALAFLSFAHLFQFLLNHPLYSTFLYAFFLGLIAASIVFCMKEIREWKPRHILCMVIGAGIAVGLTWGLAGSAELVDRESKFIVPLDRPLAVSKGLILNNYNPEIPALTHIPFSMIRSMYAKNLLNKEDIILDQSDLKSYHVKELVGERENRSWGINLWQIICGMIAISAMLLPGISGSYLLTILGMYSIVIGALSDFMLSLKMGSLDFSALSILANIFLGIVIGLLIFARIVSFLLKQYRSGTIALLIGFMIGALRSVWPFWQKTFSINPLQWDRAPELLLLNPLLPSLSDAIFWISLFFTFVGLCLVLVLESLSRRKAILYTHK